MGSVWLSLRADLRSRWPALIGLALLLGLVCGVVLAAAAGARRTDTAYPRLLRWSHAASVQVVPSCPGLGGFYRGLAQLPQVASIWTGVVYTLDRQTGEFLWATPTVGQNVISGIDGAGAVTVNPASVFTAAGQ